MAESESHTTAGTIPTQPTTSHDFTIALICALPLEADAMLALFDVQWDEQLSSFMTPDDPNTYSTGAIGAHNVVLVYMPSMGKAHAATVAAHCRSSFPNIKLAIVVGICGAVPFVPESKAEIVLGDVIISEAIIQHDFGQQLPDQFVRKNRILDALGRPDTRIRSLLTKLKLVSNRRDLRRKMIAYLETLRRDPDLEAQYPGVTYDRLFEAAYCHRDNTLSCDECQCSGKLVARHRLMDDDVQPVIHFGLVASGDTVMKSGEERDAIAKQENVLCFEMESAGVWDTFPCVVIKSACDYADSHKTKAWQRYAAATAAACTKAFLEYWKSSAAPVFVMDQTTHRILRPGAIKSNAERISELLKALNTSPYRDAKDRNPAGVEGTCEWFTNHPRFRHWSESRRPCLLWVSADPGCGKSVLAKHLVDNILPRTKSRTTCYFFFKDDFESQKSLSSALCCIIRQIIYHNRQLALDSIIEEFEAGGDTLLKSFRGLWDILMNLISLDISANLEIVCIIDALDECEEVDRSQFVKFLSQFYQAPRGPCLLKFLVTSRPYLDIRRDFWPLKSRLPTIHLSGEDEVEVEKISKEINIVVKSHISDIASTLQLTRAESEILKSELFQIPNRTYLWVHLILDELKKIINITRDNLRSKILKIPRTVDEAYEKILSRSRDIDASRKLLHIILAAKRPLSLKEIGLAMAINSSHRSYNDIEMEPETRLHHTIRALCGLFVMVVDSKVYLMHQTAKEFLLRTSINNLELSNTVRPQLWKASFWPGESNRILAKACLLCLSLEELGNFDSLSLKELENFDSRFHKTEDFFERHTLSDYSARYWPTHYRLAHFAHELEAQDAALQVDRICDIESIRFELWFRVFVSTQNLDGAADPLTTKLMLGSFLGLETVVIQQLSITDADLYIGDKDHNRFPLSWAAQGGFDNIVRLLLEKEKESRLRVPELAHAELLVNSRDQLAKTPLHEAALEGHVNIVKQFLETPGIDINPESNRARTPLFYAAANGHEAVVRLLLGFPNIKPDHKDYYMRTPLSYAAENGHEIVVRLLLTASTMELNHKDYHNRTSLSYATENGYEAVVRLLLGFSTIEVNTMDDYDRTPLSYAVRDGHETIFELLLRVPNTDLDAIDINGRTPLMYAVENGYEDICRKLIDTGQVRVHLYYPMGYALLLRAAMNGYDQITKLLLRETTVDINGTSKYTYTTLHTPLSRAIENRHDEVVKVLLDDDRVDVNAGRSNHGHAPTYLAVRNRDTEIVRLLTERDDVDLSETDSLGRSPLCIASQNGSVDILRSLLKKSAIAVNIQDNLGKTPIAMAAEAGHEAAVNLLLHTNGIDASIPDEKGQTALMSASLNGHTAVVKLLLSKAHGDVNRQDNVGQTSLWMAAANGHASIVRLLVEQQANTNLTPISFPRSNDGSPNGQTPLWIAAKNGHVEVVRVLLTAKDVDVNSVDIFRKQTSLYVAAQNGHDQVVRQLIADERVNLNPKDRQGETPLWGAMWNHHTAVASTLFQRDDMDRNSVDKLDQTLLLKAVGSNRADIVMQLLADGHVDVNVRDRHGRTPLLKAIEGNDGVIVELLLGCPETLLNVEDTDGQTPLLIALEHNSSGLVELLLRDGRIDPNARDSYGQTPIMRAAMKGSKEIVNLLLADSRVDVAATDNYGDNLVSIAVRQELWELVEHLDG